MSRLQEPVHRSDTGLSEGVLTDLERQIRALAALCERDGRSTARLVFACSAALEAEDVDSPAVQSFLRCLIGGRAFAAVSGELAAVKYAARLFLAAVAERGLAGYPLFTAARSHLSSPDCPTALLLEDARQPLLPEERAALRSMEGALDALGLSLDDRVTYFDFITAVYADRAASGRLLGGQRLLRMPEGHLLPLGGLALLELMDGEKRQAVDDLARRMSRRGPATDREAVKAALLRHFIARQLLGEDLPIPCRDMLAELLLDLREARLQGLLGDGAAPDPEDPLRWEIRIFRTVCAMSGVQPGYRAGVSGSGSGRLGSGSGSRFGSGSGSGAYGSGRTGSGSGSGRAGSGRTGSGGSGRTGSGGGVFLGSALDGDGLGGVYGLDLIDAPITGDLLLDWLMALLDG